MPSQKERPRRTRLGTQEKKERWVRSRQVALDFNNDEEEGEYEGKSFVLNFSTGPTTEVYQQRFDAFDHTWMLRFRRQQGLLDLPALYLHSDFVGETRIRLRYDVSITSETVLVEEEDSAIHLSSGGFVWYGSGSSWGVVNLSLPSQTEVWNFRIRMIVSEMFTKEEFCSEIGDVLLRPLEDSLQAQSVPPRMLKDTAKICLKTSMTQSGVISNTFHMLGIPFVLKFFPKSYYLTNRASADLFHFIPAFVASLSARFSIALLSVESEEDEEYAEPSVWATFSRSGPTSYRCEDMCGASLLKRSWVFLIRIELTKIMFTTLQLGEDTTLGGSVSPASSALIRHRSLRKQQRGGKGRSSRGSQRNRRKKKNRAGNAIPRPSFMGASSFSDPVAAAEAPSSRMELSQLRMTCSEIESECQRLAERGELLETMLETTQTESLRTQETLCRERDEAKRELTRFQRLLEKERLNSKRSRAKWKRMTESLEQKCEELEESLNSLKEKEENLLDRIRLIESEKTSCEQQIGGLKTEIDSWNQQNIRWRVEKESLQSKTDSLTQELEEVKTEILTAKHQSELAQIQHRLNDELQSKVENLSLTIKNLHLELDSRPIAAKGLEHVADPILYRFLVECRLQHYFETFVEEEIQFEDLEDLIEEEEEMFERLVPKKISRKRVVRKLKSFDPAKTVPKRADEPQAEVEEEEEVEQEGEEGEEQEDGGESIVEGVEIEED